VLGATVYTLKDPKWPSFEIDGEMLGRLSDYIAGKGGGTVLGDVWPAPDFSADARGAEIEISYQFTVKPKTISAGETATLRWQVEGARAVFLGGQEVTPHGEREVVPSRTTGYRLHIEFPDGSYKDLDAVVKVIAATRAEEAAPAPSRPPTVTLTAANIENLKRFPRPPRDNGIGLHLHPDLSDRLITESVEHLKSINATWTLIFAQDELRTEKAATACFRAGIMPVVRIGRLIDENTDPIPFVEALRKALRASDFPHHPDRPPLYVQIYNEPEDEREWRHARPSNWDAIFGRNWASQAARVYDAGAYPGIQVLDRPGFDKAVDSVIAINRQDLWQRAFFVHHNYGQNHPPVYPYDLPGLTILQDHVAALKFLAHAAWMQERLGFVLPLIGGEGGWWLGNEEDKRYPKVDWTLHAQYTQEMFDWFRSGMLSNGEPLPDYLFSITAWIVSSWTFGAQNWWGNFLSPDGKLTQTIEAVQAMSQFVRRSSWGADGEPPTTPGEPPTTPGEPPTTPGEPPTTPGEPPTTPGEPPTTPGEPPTTPGEPPTTPGEPPTTPGEPPTTTPPSGAELEWDPRLDDLGVQLTRATDPQAWRLVVARYQDSLQSRGRHHVFIRAENADGTPAAGVRFVVDWLGRHPDEVPGFTTTNAQGEGDVPIFITMHPEKKDGIQLAKAADEPSDVVTGMGLPNNHHASFVLTYRRP
jgi:hypothetical protein